MIGGRIVRDVPRVPADALAALSRFPTSIVSDSLNRLGAMDAGIRTLAAGRSFAGSALTVEEVEGGNLMSHAALELVRPGDVIVIDAKRVTSRSCWGGIQTEAALARGAVGVVVDGVVRDADEIESLGLPIFARGVAPAGPLKGWGGNVNLPIACGGAVVSPGDVVLGDDDGVVVVPLALVAALPSHCEERLAAEREWRDRVAAGEPTLDILDLRRRLDELGVVVD